MANRPSVGVPNLSRRGRILVALGVAALALLIAGSRLINTYVDWLWFGEVGFREVFTTVLVTRFVQLLVVGLLVGGLLALNLTIAYRSRPVFVPVASPEDPISRYRTGIVQRLRLVGIGAPVAVGLVAGLSAQSNWQTVQLFLNGTSFGRQDSAFGRDVGFYAFELPFYQALLSWAFVAIVISFIGALVTHYIFGGLRLVGRGGSLSGPARVQLAVLAGVFILLKAIDYYLDRYQLLFSERAMPLFTGATYTDLNAVMPAKVILLIIAMICAVAFFAGAVMRNLQLPAIATVLLVLSSILVGAAWPAILQQFSVSPNANEREAQPIARNIEATRQAYGITDDNIEYIQLDRESRPSPAEVRDDTATISNVRLLDPAVLSPTFTQLQQRQNFYGFPAQLDVDRYEVDGELQEYIVAVRELDSDSLAENQRTWINQHLVYTHGNGFVAAQANKVDAAVEEAGSGDGGYPVFTVSDTTTENSEIPVDQPRIYYGELIDTYVVVGGEEGDLPREYDNEGEYHTYAGAGGVPMGSWFHRLVFAAHHGERNLLFNQAIGSESRIIYNQNPRTRVEKVAPWLTVDGDPYPAVVDGRIKWIVDGYTTLQNYPYAQQTVLGEVTETTQTGVPLPNEEISYIRNSVKATVDAYDGTVTLYAVDESDPLLKAWMNVFPGSVTPASEISDELRQHFRYPQDLFNVQRQLLTRYHVDDPQVFFGTNNFWDVPDDPTTPGGQSNVDQPPYYLLARPPQAEGPAQFQLTSALVSLRRQFLSAYVSVSAEPGSYGEFRVLELPTDSQTLGPQQVQTRFVSESEVSRELNILRQGQSDVINANLLTLPVGDGGLLYVEPIYVERSAQESSFPQLSRVLVFYGGKLGYAPTFAEALDQVLPGAGAAATDPEQGAAPGTPESVEPDAAQPAPEQAEASAPAPGQQADMAQAVADISAALQQLRSAQSSGDFAAQGEALAALDAAAQRYQEAQGAADGAAAPAAPAGPGG